MNHNPVAVNDLVHTKAGGPSMIVRSIAGDTARCEWFDETNELCTGSFPVADLKVIIRGRR
jgi:uncharacterized protein YodC (DUF2158 family)